MKSRFETIATTVVVACLSANLALAADPVPQHVASTKADQVSVDIGPFARVVTSDPNRMKGTSATRVQNMPSEDIFLDTELKPTADGGYIVPTKTEGPSCIGLRWYEVRCLRRLELHWADATAVPAADAVQLQYWADVSPQPFWTGTSLWQGQWKPLDAKLVQTRGLWSWEIANKDQLARACRIRWVFPASKQPIALKRISAYSNAAWTTADLRVELQQPAVGRQAQVIVSNGNLLGATEQDIPLTRTWTLSKPLDLKVRYSKPIPHKADRTVLRFELPGQPVSVGRGGCCRQW